MNYRLCFLANLLTELAEQLSLSATRDLKYIKSRVEHEGLSFLTITLPTFASGLETAIERGFALASDFPAFARKEKGCLPKFLSGFTSYVFNEDGSLKPDALPDAIYAIRQISMYLKKAKIKCSTEREIKAEKSYIRTDYELSYYGNLISENNCVHLTRVATIIASALCGSFDNKSLSCSHGPGATAERLRSNERRRIRTWPIRAEPFFPSSYHTIPNKGWILNGNAFYSNTKGVAHYEHEGDNSPHTDLRYDRVRNPSGSHGDPSTDRSAATKVRFLFEKDEPPVRVVFVPKTLKSPRVIAIEPSHMQFMQQGVLRWLVPVIESNPLTRLSVHFKDQSINRESARVASIDKQYATIDLSEASDRVSLALVRKVFESQPLFLKTIEACRSKTAQVPSGELLTLNKFASMGSALCFPLEAICFYVLIQSAIHKHVGTRPSRASIESFSRYIHVYGDDIIVPVVWLESVTKELTAFGLKVNDQKSFSRSHFRESCGGDYYKGYDVKPTYFRVDPDQLSTQTDIADIVSLAEHSNQLYLKGLWQSAQFVRSIIEKKLKRKVPIRSYDSGGIVFKSVCFNTYNHWDDKFQRLVSKAVSFQTMKRADRISNDPVASTMAGLGNISNIASYDFCKSVRSHSLRRTNGWVG